MLRICILSMSIPCITLAGTLFTNALFNVGTISGGCVVGATGTSSAVVTVSDSIPIDSDCSFWEFDSVTSTAAFGNLSLSNKSETNVADFYGVTADASFQDFLIFSGTGQGFVSFHFAGEYLATSGSFLWTPLLA